MSDFALARAVRRRMRRGVARRRRDPREPHRALPGARRPPRAGHVRARPAPHGRHRASLVRGRQSSRGGCRIARVFDIVWSGRRHVMMGASQIDRFGNQNIAASAPTRSPKAQLVGVRGAPGNTVNHPTSYWVPGHSTRVVRPGGRRRLRRRLRPRRRARTRGRALPRSPPRRDEPRRPRLRHAGSLDAPGLVPPGRDRSTTSAKATGFPLVVARAGRRRRARRRPRSCGCIRDVIDPQGSAAPGARAMKAGAHAPICDLFGIQYPIIQTGMGWVAGARLTAATSAAGGLGILASATMTLPQLETAIREVRERTDRPFGVNLRTDQDDVDRARRLLVAREGQGRELRAGAAQGDRDPASEGRGRADDADDRRAGATPRRWRRWGVDAVIAQGHEGGGHTGPVPTSLLLPQVASAVDIPVARRPAGSSTAAASSPRSPTARAGSPWGRASL